MLLTICTVSGSQPAIELVNTSDLVANIKQNGDVNAAN